MFTGLIEQVGVIEQKIAHPGKLELVISHAFAYQELELGESVAVDGCCLTLTQITPLVFHVDVAEESLRRTNFGHAYVGQSVHLERAVRLQQRLGGHIVQGHVDTIAQVCALRHDGESLWLTLALPTPFMRYLVEKGSITLDGVSLTVAQTGPDHFSVMLIPYTQRHTHLAHKMIGDHLNVEVDVLAKYVEQLIKPYVQS